MDKQKSSKDTLSLSNKSPMNTSKAKAMFSFPKQQRFQSGNLQTSSQFYQKQSMLSKRAPSFGYGDKIDIALKKISPSPDKYIIQSQFNQSPKHGISLGKGRDDCKSISIFNMSVVPAPGVYNLLKDKENIKNVTMSPKLAFPPLWSESTAPGPGTYQLQKLDSNGQCILSKYCSKNSFKIYPKSPQKQNKVLEMIGPGTYNTNLSSTGRQVLARNKTQKSFIFSKKQRQTMKQDIRTPGPGAYQHYSIFGLI